MGGMSQEHSMGTVPEFDRFATKINAETHDLRAIQKMLGHASLATTQRYVGTDAGQLRDALHHAA